MAVEIKHYKVPSLTGTLEKNSVYYVLDVNSGKIKTYITSKIGEPIPLIDLTSTGGIQSLTGTGVTGGISNRVVNISTFVSSQLGNLVYLSTEDGKLQVNQITSPDSSLNITYAPTETQIEISDAIANTINSALQVGDNISSLTGTKADFNATITDGDFLFVGDVGSPYTDEQAQDAVGGILSGEFTYTDSTPLIEINTISQTKITNLLSDLEEIRDDIVALAVTL